MASNENTNKLSNTTNVWTSLLAGAIAGALAKTTIAPLDRTKINFQISNEPYSVKKCWAFLKKTYFEEGLPRLWRGNTATMARIVPYAAIQFTAHEQWKRVLNVSPKSPPHLQFLAGSLAGVTSQSLTYPLDLARARMAVTPKDQYSHLTDVFIRIMKEEGPKSFFRGYLATVLGVIPYAGCSFFTYGFLKNWYTEHHFPQSPIFNLMCGAVAGLVGQTSSYPLDIVRRRMQTAGCKGNGEKYSTVLGTITTVLREEGIGAFYKGLTLNFVKGPVAVGISFATYDFIRDTVRQAISRTFL